MSTEINTNVVVIGAGPAGYSAAFRCADLGLETILIERYNKLGGVCLNVGCIPSKSLLHISKIIEETNSLISNKVIFGELNINIDKLRLWKEKIIDQLINGLTGMSKNRKVKVINGLGKFINHNSLIIENNKEEIIINFNNAIIATGSSPNKLPFIPYNDSRVWDSTDALKLIKTPKRMLIIGGGIIGLEIATIYYTLGSKIDIIEMSDQVIYAADIDIINFFTKQINKKFNLMFKTKVTNVEAKEDGIYVTIIDDKLLIKTQCYDVILIAIGRNPNSNLINADKVGLEIDNKGFIRTNKQMRTNISNIYAIGDITSTPMLAHKATYEAHIAAEVISGMKHYFNPKIIPMIAYTNPEVAWVGLTEKEAEKKGINYEVSIFPWIASGRAIASNCSDGITKLIFNKDNNQIIGGAIVGINGGELLGEISLAIEMGCNVQDISLTIHAHPTLYESIGRAAELFDGSITDFPNPKKIIHN